MNDQPPPASPQAEGTALPGAATSARTLEPPFAAADPPSMTSAPVFNRPMLAAALTTAILLSSTAGYRFFEKQRTEAAAEAVRARAYVEANVKAETAMAMAKVEPPLATRASARAATPEPTVRPAKQASPPAAKKLKPPPPHVKRDAGAQPQRKLAKTQPARPPVAAQQLPRPLPVSQAKSVDQIYSERSVRECAEGFMGLICREFLKAHLCRKHDAFGKASICPAVGASQPLPGTMG